MQKALLFMKSLDVDRTGRHALNQLCLASETVRMIIVGCLEPEVHFLLCFIRKYYLVGIHILTK